MLQQPLLLVLLWSTPLSSGDGEDWSASPEASFLTREERKAWKALSSEQAREEFKTAYWRRRDPTPGTDRNEFKETVLTRIRTADARFGSATQAGSRTARGQALIVLGMPAIERQTAGPLSTAPVWVLPGQLGLPREAFESTEWHAWVYQRGQNRELLDTLGRPTAEVTFVIQPGRGDEMQPVRQFAGFQEIVARRSIVSP
jgi:GWxTD domain-containing protein